MNDLIEVQEALGQPEPPSQAAYADARVALMQRAAAARIPAPAPSWNASRGSRARGVRHRRAGWLAGGLSLTAAAAAAVAVIVAAGTPGGPNPGGSGSGSAGNPQARGISQLSGRQILLDAASAAATAPAGNGTYWYVDELASGSAAKTATESWYTHDGTVYTMIPQDKGVFLASPHAGFSIGASSLTYQQIQRLPTSPAALTAWITRSFFHPSAQPATPGGTPRTLYSPPPRAGIPADVAISLSELLSQVPAPGAVRAAAFRALAAMPDVTKLGEAGGDVVLQISGPALPAGKFPGGRVPVGSGKVKLVIDASAFALHAWSDYTGTTTIIAARWTDALPRIIPAGQLASPQWARG